MVKKETLQMLLEVILHMAIRIHSLFKLIDLMNYLNPK